MSRSYSSYRDLTLVDPIESERNIRVFDISGEDEPSRMTMRVVAADPFQAARWLLLLSLIQGAVFGGFWVMDPAFKSGLFFPVWFVALFLGAAFGFLALVCWVAHFVLFSERVGASRWVTMAIILAVQGFAFPFLIDKSGAKGIVELNRADYYCFQNKAPECAAAKHDLQSYLSKDVGFLRWVGAGLYTSEEREKSEVWKLLNNKP